MCLTRDEKYLNIILSPIRVCANYRPKLGQRTSEGYTLEGFQKLYRADSFYTWFGLDNPLIYAAHKAAGGMTSVYRQIGIGCEHLFREILTDYLMLTSEQVNWSYEIPGTGNRKRKLSLDARIPLENIQDTTARERVKAWIAAAAADLDVEPSIINSLTGAVFEVRQGYKSKDSKRQNADLANAATAYTKSYFPCILVLSSQIDTDIVLRYRASKWFILTGMVGANDPLKSTYDFVKNVVGYDLAAFFERNSETIKNEVDVVLEALLSSK
ncbi:MAG: hypothetical protein F6K47_07390 [Symploca sp. SIO2E6]|nr:hypothetical protein [Symploca sp. SIO2E6]